MWCTCNVPTYIRRATIKHTKAKSKFCLFSWSSAAVEEQEDRLNIPSWECRDSCETEYIKTSRANIFFDSFAWKFGVHTKWERVEIALHRCILCIKIYIISDFRHKRGENSREGGMSAAEEEVFLESWFGFFCALYPIFPPQCAAHFFFSHSSSCSREVHAFVVYFFRLSSVESLVGFQVYLFSFFCCTEKQNMLFYDENSVRRRRRRTTTTIRGEASGLHC